jgi:predicted MFS family arabinose efflux permease
VASLGGVLSATLGGVVATFLSWRAIFLVYGVLALVVSAMMLRLPVKRVRTSATRSKGILGPYLRIFELAGRRAVALYVLVFVEGFAATSTLGYLGAFLFERDGLSYAVIGMLITISGIASMLTGRIVGRLVRRIEERGMLLLGGSMLALAYFLVGLTPMLLFFPVAMLLAGSGFVIAHSTLQSRATELVPSMRGTAVALFAFSLFLGGGLGTYVAGLAIEGLGFMPTLLGTGTLLIGFTLLSQPLLRLIQRP